MLANKNNKHPRIITNDQGEITYKKFPMCYSTGNFADLVVNKYKTENKEDPSGGITDFD